MINYFWQALSLLDQAMGKVVVSFVAAAILAVGAYFYKRPKVQDALDILRLRFLPGSTTPNDQKRVRARSRLLNSLRRDQSKSGPHYGQFGKLWSLEEEARFQTGFENIHVKPRMYLTVWPALILKKRGHLRFSVQLAVQGIERLMRDGRIHLFQSASPHPVHAASFVSVRHTISAAILLQNVKGWDLTTRSILGAMLDRTSHWQNDDGGWTQWDKGETQSDLFGSAYAAHFLETAIRSDDIKSSERLLARHALMETLRYLRYCWDLDRWKLRGVCSEENVPYIFNEVSPILRAYDDPFLRDVRRHINSWLTPTGDLADWYIETCTGTSPASLCARLAYGIYRSGADKTEWVPLLDRAIHKPGDAINSADMAFLLDMTYFAAE